MAERVWYVRHKGNANTKFRAGDHVRLETSHRVPKSWQGQKAEVLLYIVRKKRSWGMTFSDTEIRVRRLSDGHVRKFRTEVLTKVRRRK